MDIAAASIPSFIQLAGMSEMLSFMQSTPVPTFPDTPNPINNVVTFARELAEGFATNAFTAFGPFVTAAWKAMAIVYIAFTGWQILFTGRFDIASIGSALLKISIILVAVTQIAFFNTVFIRIFFDTPDQIGGLLVRDLTGSLQGAEINPDTAGISSAIGDFWASGFTLAGRILSLDTTGVFSSFGLIIPALAVMLATILLCVAAAIILVLSYLAIGIFLGVAPFFILLAMFQSTRPFFEGWLRMLMNYTLVPLFVYATISMAFFIAQPAFAEIASELNSIGALSDEGPFFGLGTSEQEAAANGFNIWGAIASLLFAGIVATVLMSQVLQMAAGVAGGFALNTGRLISRTLAPARNLGRNLTTRVPVIGKHARKEASQRRELGYLRRTQGLQRQLADARGGGPSRAAPAPSSTRELPAPAGTTGAGTPSGAANGGRS